MTPRGGDIYITTPTKIRQTNGDITINKYEYEEDQEIEEENSLDSCSSCCCRVQLQAHGPRPTLQREISTAGRFD